MKTPILAIADPLKTLICLALLSFLAIAGCHRHDFRATDRRLPNAKDASDATSDSVDEDEDLLAASTSLHPYQYRSLASLSNEELVDFMKSGRNLSDLEKNRNATVIPMDFWKTDAKAAIAAFLQKNGAGHAAAALAGGSLDPKFGSAPEEGTIELSDSPHGLMNFGVAYQYVLRCKLQSSYFIALRRFSPRFEVDPLELAGGDLRFISLTYEEARHLLQAVWWLHQSLAAETTAPSGSGKLDWSDVGYTSLRFEARPNSFGMGGRRCPDFIGAELRMTGGAYDEDACVNLTADILVDEVVRHLAERWAQLDVFLGQGAGVVPKFRDYSAKQLDRLKATVNQVLTLYEETGEGLDLARETVGVAEDLALIESRTQLERISSLLHEQGSDPDKLIPRLRAQIEETLRWFDAYNDPIQLQLGAADGSLNRGMACHRLRELNPGLAISALEGWAAAESNPWNVQELFELVDNIKAERSGGSAPGIDDAATRTILALTKLPAGATPEAQATALIAMTSRREKMEPGQLALKLLAPSNDPLKFKGAEVDDCLIRLTESSDEFIAARACLALAARGGKDHWDRIAALSKDRRYGLLLPSLTVIALKDPEPCRNSLRDILKANLTETYGMINETFWAAWFTNQRELKSLVEQLATEDSSAVEGFLSWGQKSQRTPVKFRYHAARQVAALWNEEDAVTRCKLEVLLGMIHPFYLGAGMGLEPSTAADQLTALLKEEAGKLSPEQRVSVRRFADWCEAENVHHKLSWQNVPQFANWIATARAVLSQ